MENEKDLLKKDLEKTNDTAGLEQFKKDIEGAGHEDLEALAQAKIDAIKNNLVEIAKNIESQVSEKTERVKNIGGTMEELEAKVAPVQEEIKEVQKNAGEQIAAVENQEVQTNIEDATYMEKTIENLETIKQSPHFADLLESAKKIEGYNNKYANQSTENPTDQFFVEDAKKEVVMFNTLLKQIFGDNRNGGRKIDDPKTIINIDQAIKNWKANSIETQDKDSNIPEHLRESITVVEKNLAHTQENIDAMSAILNSTKEKLKSMDAFARYNELVIMVNEIAAIAGNGNYATGLEYIRNPEAFDLVNEKVALEHTEVAQTIPENDPQDTLRRTTKIYSPEIEVLMKKREDLVASVRNILKEALAMRGAAKEPAKNF